MYQCMFRMNLKTVRVIGVSSYRLIFIRRYQRTFTAYLKLFDLLVVRVIGGSSNIFEKVLLNVQEELKPFELLVVPVIGGSNYRVTFLRKYQRTFRRNLKPFELRPVPVIEGSSSRVIFQRKIQRTFRGNLKPFELLVVRVIGDWSYQDHNVYLEKVCFFLW